MSLRTVAGGDPQVVPLDQGLAADRLLGGDVVLDDGAQHVQLAVIEASSWSPRSRLSVNVLLALHASECQSTSPTARYGDREFPSRPGRIASVCRRLIPPTIRRVVRLVAAGVDLIRWSYGVAHEPTTTLRASPDPNVPPPAGSPNPPRPAAGVPARHPADTRPPPPGYQPPPGRATRRPARSRAAARLRQLATRRPGRWWPPSARAAGSLSPAAACSAASAR